MSPNSGVFKAKVDGTSIKNDKIYIAAYNGYVWGGNDTYLIDYSFDYKAPEPAAVALTPKNIAKSLNLASYAN